jgi:integrase
MLILTGQRCHAVMTMRWDDLDLSARRWRISAAEGNKVRRITWVPLIPPAVDLLQAMRTAHPKGEYVFPSPVTGEPYYALKLQWARILHRAGIENLHIHDLRRTMGTMMAGQNVAIEVIAKALGHASTASTRTYARYQLDPTNAAMTLAYTAMTDQIRAVKPLPPGRG